MTGRPPFSIEEFVRTRNAFAGGRGPADAWTRITEISLWRLDELAEEAGSRAWSILIAPVEPGPDDDGIGERLQHAVRSAGLGTVSLPAFWRVHADRVTVSRVMVVFGIEEPRAVHLARRYGQLAVVHMRRVPFEQIVVLDLVGEQRVEMPRYDPAAIADALARVVGADAVAVVYRATGLGESQLMAAAERRLQTQEEFAGVVAARQAPREK